MTPELVSANVHANELGDKAQYADDKHLEELRAWLGAEEAFVRAAGISEELVDPEIIADPILIRGIACELRSGRTAIMRIMH